MKHTKGPWKVANDTGFAIAIRKEGTPLIASVRYSENPTINKDIGLANAHLIAAAPEMLEALEGVRLFLMDEALPTKNGALNLINSAIKKARGE